MSAFIHGVHDALTYLQIDPSTPADPTAKNLNTSGILSFVTRAIVPIILAFIGVIILGRARSGRFSEVMTTVAIVVTGVVMLGAAAILPFVGGSLVNILFQ